MQHTGGFACVGICVALRTSQPGTILVPLAEACAMQPVEGSPFEEIKIVLCGQGGSVFSLSEFQYQQVPCFSWTVLYMSRLLLPDLIRNTKHGGRTVQPREINQRNSLSSHFCSLKTSHFSLLARSERNTAFLKRKKTTNAAMLALTKT